MENLIFAIWYFLPAGVANMVPILAAHSPILKKWNAPLDFGMSSGGIRIFGDHKTIRGVLTGVLAGILVGALQMQYANEFGAPLGMYENLYLGQTALVLGGLLALGALSGDAIKSFFKRRIGVQSGKSWFPYDQSDYIVGACVLGSVAEVLSIGIYGSIFLIWFGAHLAFSYIGFKIGLKDLPI